MPFLQPAKTNKDPHWTPDQASFIIRNVQALPRDWTYLCIICMDSEDKMAFAYHLVALSEHPIYTIYNAGCAMMGLSFFYLPDPLSPLFIPCYSKGTPFHCLLFYKEHDTNSHKRKHAEETTVLAFLPFQCHVRTSACQSRCQGTICSTSVKVLLKSTKQPTLILRGVLE